MTEKSRRYKGELKRVKLKGRTNLLMKLRRNKGIDNKKYCKILYGQKKNLNIPIILTRFYKNFKQLPNDENNTNIEINIDHDNDDTDRPLVLD